VGTHRVVTPTLGSTPKATPTGRTDTDHRVRHGNVSVRINGQVHHIGLGRPINGTPVILLVADLDIRIVNAATGEVLRALTLDPTRDYQPTGKPRSQKRQNPRT